MIDLAETIQVGDRVARFGGYATSVPDIAIVDAVTPSGRIRVGTEYFDRHGRIIGRGYRYNRPYIERLTPEIEEQVERHNICYRLQNRTDWSKLPTETLRAVYRLVKDPHNGI